MPLRSFTSGSTVVKEVEIACPPERVYSAFTVPEMLNSWFTHGAVVDLRVGGRYSNGDGDEGTYLDLVPPNRLRFSFRPKDHPPGAVVEILLHSTGRFTVVTLIHSGLKDAEDVAHFSSNESGWNWALENLKGFLELGKTEDYHGWKQRLG